MSLLGKIFAVLNVLAVLGALALLNMTYSRTRAWQYAVFKQELTLQGLPLDRDSADDQGRPLYLKINSEVQKELFPQGNAVTTQQEEVDRVKQLVLGQVQGMPDREGQITAYARALLPLAVTAADRARLWSYLTNLQDDKSRKQLQARLAKADEQARSPAKPAEAGARVKPYDELFRDAVSLQAGPRIEPFTDAYLRVVQADPAQRFAQAYPASLDAQLKELADWLEQQFNEALTPPPNATGLPSGQKPLHQQRIARLLFNLVDVVAPPAQPPAANADLVSQPGYRRFFAVVGVTAATAAIYDQAQTLQAIAPEVDSARLRERGLFALEHTKLVDVVQSRAMDIAEHRAELERRQRELTAQGEVLRQRELNVKELTEEVEAARKKTSTDLKVLQRMSDALFKARVELRDATAQSQQLEKEIRELESER